MSNILSRVAAVGIVAGGFALTGDLGQLAKRGFDVVNSRDVPWPTSSDTGHHSDETAPSPPAESEAPRASNPTEPVVTASEIAAPVASPPQPVIVRNAEFRPPRESADEVDPASLDAGGRVVVWLAMPRRSGGRAYRCLVFDMVDPPASEALAYEAVSLAADGTPQATSAPPHRVRIRGDGPGGAIVRGGGIDVQRRGVAADGTAAERIGPIAAVDVVL